MTQNDLKDEIQQILDDLSDVVIDPQEARKQSAEKLAELIHRYVAELRIMGKDSHGDTHTNLYLTE